MGALNKQNLDPSLPPLKSHPTYLTYYPFVDDEVTPYIIVEVDLENFNGTKSKLVNLSPSLAWGEAGLWKGLRKETKKNREGDADQRVPDWLCQIED